MSVPTTTVLPIGSFVQAMADDGPRSTVLRELTQFFIWTGCTRIQASLAKGRLEFRFDAAAGKALAVMDYAKALPLLRVFSTAPTLYLAQGGSAMSLTAAGAICTTEIGFELGTDAHAVLPVAIDGVGPAVEVVNQELERVLRIELARAVVMNSQLTQVDVSIEGVRRFLVKKGAMSTDTALDGLEVVCERLDLITSDEEDTCILRTFRQGKCWVGWLPEALSRAAGDMLGGVYGPALTCWPLQTSLVLKAPFSRSPIETLPSFAIGRMAAHNRAQLVALGRLLDIAVLHERRDGLDIANGSEELDEQLRWYPRALSELVVRGIASTANSDEVEDSAEASLQTLAPSDETTLQSLRLPGRALGGLRLANFHYLKDVAHFSDDQLRAIPGVGDKAVEVLRAAIRRANDRETNTACSLAEAEVPSMVPLTLASLVSAWLAPLPALDRAVLEKYYGLDGGERLSLRAIADIMRRPAYLIDASEARGRQALEHVAPPEILGELMSEVLASFEGIGTLNTVARAIEAAHDTTGLSVTGFVELMASTDVRFGLEGVKGRRLVFSPKTLYAKLMKAAKAIDASGSDEVYLAALRRMVGPPAVGASFGPTVMSVIPKVPTSLTPAVASEVPVETIPAQPSLAYRTFDSAKALVHELRFMSREAFATWASSEARPADVPAEPDAWYGEEDWTSWDDWLGIIGKASAPMPFDEARSLTRSRRFGSLAAWDAFVAAAADDALGGLPRDPAKVYARLGWRGWADWLGLSMAGVDPGAISASLEAMASRLGALDRAGAQAFLKELGVWRYPLVGSIESERIVGDLLSLPYAGKRQEACFQLANRIDRALIAERHLDDEWD